MHAYYFDNIPGDQRLPHDSGRPVSEKALRSLGVHNWHIPVDSENWKQRVTDIAEERQCRKCNDIMGTKEAMGDKFDEKMKTFFTEHMHEDQEIAYVQAGSCYFDVHEHTTDDWIRVHLVAGDMLNLPAGIYHRFTVDTGNSAHVLRLFEDEDKCGIYNRGAETDASSCRLEYLKRFTGVAFGA
ncbi:1,2-dihydroxy-3-keto-5-methylthiopentene dioxygenase 1 [Grifola frondosa]|uniref:Acireductone dioxygenase n=1 Tax=Grifola frondosa TaxID=5627 RepID=A0A1C7M9U7_GRIFR|nr:1,2-dihydroxy-3-keto-5-methylthiopentene dioxygenase 1 [Grifola frondosa]